MGEMDEYVFVGGPADGRRIRTDGARVFIVPVMRPFQVTFGRKVLPFRRGLEPSMDEARYERFGRIYWWEGLIGDAFAEMAVSDEAMAEIGPTIRTFIRAEFHHYLEDLADGKGLGRIIWRIVSRDHLRGLTTIRALVGPRATEYGMDIRTKRRAGVPI